MTRALGLLVLGLLGAMLVWNVRFVRENADALRPLGKGDPAPAFAVVGFGGAPGTSRDDLLGRVALVDFWATWCGPCRASMPAIERVWKRHQAAGLAVVSINVESRRMEPRARAFAERMGLTFPLYGDAGQAMGAFRVDAIPHMLLIDKRGLVRWVHVGGMGRATEDALDGAVRTLLAE